MNNRNLEKQVDALWSKAIHILYEGKCARCGSTIGCSPHHLIKRRYKRTRHAILNGVLLCGAKVENFGMAGEGLQTGCHQEAEENPKEFMRWLRHKQWKNFVFAEENKWPEPLKPLEQKDLLTNSKETLEWFVNNWEGQNE